MTTSLETESAILQWLDARQPEMEALLAALVSVDSGSGDDAGVDAVLALLATFLGDHGVNVRRIPAGKGAALLDASVAEEADGPLVLLLGHADTVFPSGTVALRPFSATPERLYGPGVADMKAGLVMQAFVLAAFAQAGSDQRPLRGLFTTDEEIASPVSRQFILQAALGATIALNAEPGRANGNVVTERKGGIFIRIRIVGKATHSGIDFPGGASAIVELAHKIVALEKLTDLPAGITVNVGLISGGQSINTVAPNAEASVDIRYVAVEQRTRLLARLKEIIYATTTPGTRTDLEIVGEFHPMVPSVASSALLASYQAAAGMLGFQVQGESTGGCSDAGFAASLGTPTLCGLGPVGGLTHTEDEYVERASLVPRAQATALTILRHLPAPADPNTATPSQATASGSR